MTTHGDDEIRAEAPGERAVAARDIGSVHTGDVYHADILPLPGRVELPAGRVTNLPRRPRATFVGRARELAALSRTLDRGPGVIAQAISGLGGIGKSELALQYCARHRVRYRLIWWVTAESKEQVSTGLADLTRHLCRHSTRVGDEAQLVGWALDWLQLHPDWLLVLDNVERADDVAELLGQLDDASGHVLVTTRRDAGWNRLGLSVLKLDLFSTEESIDLLQRLTDDRDRESAEQVTVELDHLPLAIEQAGSYVQQTRTSLRDYVDLLKVAPGNALGWTEDEDGERSVALVWSETVTAIRAQDPVAAQLLDLLAWLAPDDVPRSLLVSGTRTAAEVDRALALLASYSMVSLAPKTVSTHRLVQAVQRRGDPDPGRSRHEAVEILSAAVPGSSDEPAEWPRWRSLISHCEAVLEHCHGVDSAPPVAGLADRAGSYLVEQGRLATGLRLHELAVAASAADAGERSAVTADRMQSLANALREAGRLTESIRTFRTVLDIRRELPGSAAAEFETMNGLGVALSEDGDTTESVELLEKVLAGKKEMLGSDEPSVLRVRSNLALAYEGAGRLADALVLYESALADRERVLGPDNPETQLSLHNLAGAYDAARRYDDALALYERLIDGRTRLLGASHPETLHSRLEFAGLHLSTGDNERAVALYRAAARDCREHLGDDHPRTSYAQMWLGEALLAAGAADEAVTALAAAYEGYGRTVGFAAKAAEQTREGLTRACRATGRWDVMATALETALAGTRIDDADRRRVQVLLADAYERTGRDDDQLKVRWQLVQAAGTTRYWSDLLRACVRHDRWREVTVLRQKLLLTGGEEELAFLRSSLVSVYTRAGRWPELIGLREELLRRAGRHGEELDGFYADLAEAYAGAEQWDDELRVYQLRWAEDERTLGPDHPLTLRVAEEVVERLIYAGRYAEAADLAGTMRGREDGGAFDSWLMAALISDDQLEAAADLPTADSGSAGANRGFALSWLGRFDEAERALTASAERHGTDSRTSRSLGWTLMQLGRFSEVGEAAQEYPSLAPALITVASRGIDDDAVDTVRRVAARSGRWELADVLLWALDRGSVELPGQDVIERRTLPARDVWQWESSFSRAEIVALTSAALGRAEEGARRLAEAAEQRLGGDRFLRPVYQVLSDAGVDVGPAVSVWREIIAVDPSAAGPWGGPEG